jgi:hypothetical protein
MELAAVASFAILVVAWIVAPDRPRTLRAVETPITELPQQEAQRAAA